MRRVQDAKSDLPFDSEFSPTQIDLPVALKLVRERGSVFMRTIHATTGSKR